MEAPFGLGIEAAGVIEELGSGVSGFEVGDRIAYGNGPIGAYCEAANRPVAKIAKLPDNISDEQAAGIMLKGLTAQMLLRRVYNVKPGDTILFQAVSGGVGSIACQWAKSLGATVIGTVGSEEKAEQARTNGCDHVIMYREENIAERVKEITDGKGVAVAYDGVGKDTLMASLDIIAPMGTLVFFGTSSGPVKSFDPNLLIIKGSLFLTRPSIGSYAGKEEDLRAMTADVFDVVSSGKVKIDVKHRYSLEDVAQAHIDLEARRTSGSVVLVLDGS